MTARDARGRPATKLGRSRRADRDLTRELAHLRGLVEDLDAIVWEADDGGEFRFVSEGTTTIVGFTPDEWLAERGFWIRHLHPDDRARAIQEFKQASTIPGALHDIEYRFLARGDRVLWLRQVGHVVADLDARSTVVRGLILDVTARKVIEEQHRDAEARYRALVEQLPVVVYTEPISEDAGGDTSVMYVSPRSEDMLGIPPAEWMRDPGIWLRSVHPDDRERVRSLDEEADRTMEPFTAEYRMLTRDGRTIWIHDESAVLYDEDVTPIQWQGVMVDITAQRRAAELERDLRVERETAQRLREVDEMKNTFLQAVSHDLRTPLAAILGLAITLGRDDIELETDEVHELGTRIASNARKLDRLVHDLLDLDRLSRGIIEPNFKETDVGELVLRLVRESDQSLRRKVQADIDHVVAAVDPPRVERIVENLLANSAKHAPTSSHVWVATREADGGVLIVIEDDGPGVPAEVREEIFEPFNRGPASPVHAPGAGIGLSLVRRFSQLQGGNAWVEEREGGGASFRVFLPDARQAGAEFGDEGSAGDDDL
jgi:PAS domain S-box-containing protein